MARRMILVFDIGVICKGGMVIELLNVSRVNSSSFDFFENFGEVMILKSTNLIIFHLIIDILFAICR